MTDTALITLTRDFIASEVYHSTTPTTATSPPQAAMSCAHAYKRLPADSASLLPTHPSSTGAAAWDWSSGQPSSRRRGYSLFGPLALGIAAPDEGNVHLLDQIATGSQRTDFLEPLARGEVRSAFAMTEPAPGAGSDPTALATIATKVDHGWIINGRKLFITGADGASFFITMARTSGQPGARGGATMFLITADTDGVDVVRHVETVDRSMIGGHCEVVFADAFVPDTDVLGGVDEGFRYAQVRLGPARMTHVMRWTGAARRAHEAAVRHVANRKAFGSTTQRPGNDPTDDRRQRDRPRCHPSATPFRLRGTGRRPTRIQEHLDREDIRRRGASSCRRSRHANVRRARCVTGVAGRAHRP